MQHKPNQGASHDISLDSPPIRSRSRPSRPAATAPATVERCQHRRHHRQRAASTSILPTRPTVPTCHVNTGDQVHQKAYWDAGGANAYADKYSTANGGNAESNGDQHNYSGHDTSNVSADTTAYQTNFLAADMSQNVRPASEATAATTTTPRVGMCTCISDRTYMTAGPAAKAAGSRFLRRSRWKTGRGRTSKSLAGDRNADAAASAANDAAAANAARRRRCGPAQDRCASSSPMAAATISCFWRLRSICFRSTIACCRAAAPTR